MGIAQCSKQAEETLKGAIFPNRGTSSAFEYYPVISDVKSVAWGHCGDAYNPFEDSIFREILVVCGDNGIIIHAFRNTNRNEVFESIPTGEAVQGKWVEWGSTHRTCENLNDINKPCETSESVSANTAVGDGGSFSRSIPRNWLHTFLTKLDTVVSNGKYSARYPAKSSLPHSAEVVSFDIYDNTLNFLKFLSCATPLCDKKENSSDETVVGQVGNASFPIESGSGGILFRCSRVFSSSSHHLIGLVLNFPENTSDKSSEAYIRYSGKVFVVVMMLNQWGLQWVCSIDLQDQYPSPGQSPKWADFQFSEDFLVCLNTTGLICIWGAKTGGLVARFDVLKSCGLDLNVGCGLNKSKLSVNGDSAPTTSKSKLSVNRDSAPTTSQEADQNNEVHGRETCVEDILSARTFRRLMVVSHSFLLAVTDEYGVIYVICAAEYVSEKCGIPNFFDYPYKYSNCGMLAGWKVAGCEIGSQKWLSDLSPCPPSYVPNLSIEGSSNKNHTRLTRGHRHADGKETQLHTYASGFCMTSQKNGWKISSPESGIASAPLRKVFLPLDRFNKEDSICFSPFGITRLVRNCSVEQQKNYKIVHTSLHVVSPVHDDRDLETLCMSKSCASIQEITFSGESIGCSFHGCLYLVTQDGLSVILPSVSVSSSIFAAESSRYWQPNSTTGGESQIKILLATNEFKELGRPWQIEVVDRTLLYEGPQEAERICLENGEDWFSIDVLFIAYLTFRLKVLFAFFFY